jgi:hypothetical protein
LPPLHWYCTDTATARDVDGVDDPRKITTIEEEFITPYPTFLLGGVSRVSTPSITEKIDGFAVG